MAKREAFVGPQESPIGVSLKKKEKEGEERMEEEKRADGATPLLPSSLLSWDVSQEKATLGHVVKGCCLCETRHPATKWNGSHDNTVIYLEFRPPPPTKLVSRLVRRDSSFLDKIFLQPCICPPRNLFSLPQHPFYFCKLSRRNYLFGLMTRSLPPAAPLAPPFVSHPSPFQRAIYHFMIPSTQQNRTKSRSPQTQRSPTNPQFPSRVWGVSICVCMKRARECRSGHQREGHRRTSSVALCRSLFYCPGNRVSH